MTASATTAGILSEPAQLNGKPPSNVQPGALFQRLSRLRRAGEPVLDEAVTATTALFIADWSGVEPITNWSIPQIGRGDGPSATVH